MHILCPHCRNPIEVVKLTPREEVSCPSCGSSFCLETESTTAERAPGQKLGRFEVLEALGQGAFGTVFKARDPELDRVIAIKVPRAGNLAGPQDLDRFLREARSVAQLRHPSIVSVHEVGQADGVPYLVSDFVQGVTLTDLLSARRPGFREAAELVASVADALQYAHERGVVHRDVKPSNIMIGDDGKPCVMDFGLAKRDAGEITMTMEGQVLGTPAYMSPEQARGDAHTVDGRSDVYSLGVVLYQLLTGELPFRGTKRMLLHQVLQDEPRPPRSLNDHIPRDLETICLKAMAKEPARRYATAQELADDLRRWLNGEPIRARRTTLAERAVRWCRRNPVVASLSAGVLLAMTVGTAVSIYFAVQAQEQEQKAHDQEQKANEKAGEAAAREAGERAEKQRVQRLLYNARINLAQNALRDLQIKELRELLAEAEPRPGEEDLRGFEYWYLWRQVNSAARTLTLKDPESASSNWLTLSSQFLSEDGRRVARVGSLGWPPGDLPDRSRSVAFPFTFWDASDGRLVGTARSSRASAMSPDGRRAAWYVAEGKVVVWDIDAGKEHSTWPVKHLPRSIAFDRRGERLAVLEPDRPPGRFTGGTIVETEDIPHTLRIWDLSGNRAALSVPVGVHPGSPLFNPPPLLFTPDDREVVLCLGEKGSWFDNHPRSWTVRSTEDGTERQAIEQALTVSGQVQYLRAIISPDSRWLVVGDRTVAVVDLHSGKKLPVQFSLASKNLGDGWELALSPDGRTLAVSSHRVSEVRLFDFSYLAGVARDGEVLTRIASRGEALDMNPTRILLGQGDGIGRLAFSPDGSRLVALDLSGTLCEWDLSRPDVVPLDGLSGGNFSFIFSADGQRLAAIPKAFPLRFQVTTSRPNLPLGVWDAGGRQLVRRSIDLHNVPNLDFSQDGRRLAHWSVPPQISPQETMVWAVHGLGRAADGTGLFTAVGLWSGLVSSPSPVRVIDVDTDRDLFTLPPQAAPVRFSPDGRLLVGGNIVPVDEVTLFGGLQRSADIDWHVWDARTGRAVMKQRPPEGSRVVVAFRPDGRRLAAWTASGPESGELTLWDLDAGRALFSQPWPSLPESLPVQLVFSPDGRRLAAVGDLWDDGKPFSRRLTLWDVRDDGAQVLMDSPPSNRIVPFAFSPDGASLAVKVAARGVTVWDAQAGKERSVLRGLGDEVSFLSFSPDGRRLVTVDRSPLDRSVGSVRARVWDVGTGQDLLSLVPTQQPFGTFHFDGRRIRVTAGIGIEETSLRAIDGSPAP